MKYSLIMSQYKQLPYLIENKEKIKQLSYRDFEVIVASDDDDQNVLDWCELNVDKYVYQKNEGYRLSHILNKAVDVASGDYLVFIMGDSYPKSDFLDEIDKVISPEKVVNGIRMNVDRDGNIISSDWRVASFGQELEDKQPIWFPEPWRAMTLNGQVMARQLFEKIGGMCEEYHLYGREDWDLNMRAHFAGAEMWWANTAIVYHRDHVPQDDSPENIALFEQRKEKYEYDSGTIQKQKYIMDPERAKKKEQERLEWLNKIAMQEKEWEKEDQ